MNPFFFFFVLVFIFLLFSLTTEIKRLQRFLLKFQNVNCLQQQNINAFYTYALLKKHLQFGGKSFLV